MATEAEHHGSKVSHDLGLAVLTVSDSRSLEDDRSGAQIIELASAAGHRVTRRDLVPDDAGQICAAVQAMAEDASVRWIVVTGGTGPAPRDVTIDAVRGLFRLELPGFGELFRMLSYEAIGSAAMLSRACAGVVGNRPAFLLPGSTAAVELAMERLILPQIGHLVELARGE